MLKSTVFVSVKKNKTFFHTYPTSGEAGPRRQVTTEFTETLSAVDPQIPESRRHPRNNTTFHLFIRASQNPAKPPSSEAMSENAWFS